MSSVSFWYTNEFFEASSAWRTFTTTSSSIEMPNRMQATTIHTDDTANMDPFSSMTTSSTLAPSSSYSPSSSSSACLPLRGHLSVRHVIVRVAKAHRDLKTQSISVGKRSLQVSVLLRMSSTRSLPIDSRSETNTSMISLYDTFRRFRFGRTSSRFVPAAESSQMVRRSQSLTSSSLRFSRVRCGIVLNVLSASSEMSQFETSMKYTVNVPLNEISKPSFGRRFSRGLLLRRIMSSILLPMKVCAEICSRLLYDRSICRKFFSEMNAIGLIFSM
uniref:Uncharacterized protein n=1 Tax=Anopheles coluzzii TaxID=1518534 RepID=A0A8W7PZ82_ANOCL